MKTYTMKGENLHAGIRINLGGEFCLITKVTIDRDTYQEPEIIVEYQFAGVARETLTSLFWEVWEVQAGTRGVNLINVEA